MSHAGVPPPPAPPTLRIFARLRSFDLACPHCDRVQAVNSQTNRRIWDPKVARFQCLGCFQVFHLGMVVWQAGRGAYRTPTDQTPTVAQALALRRGLNLYTQTKLMRSRDTNMLETLPSTAELPEELEAAAAAEAALDARPKAP